MLSRWYLSARIRSSSVDHLPLKIWFELWCLWYHGGHRNGCCRKESDHCGSTFQVLKMFQIIHHLQWYYESIQLLAVISSCCFPVSVISSNCQGITFSEHLSWYRLSVSKLSFKIIVMENSRPPSIAAIIRTIVTNIGLWTLIFWHILIHTISQVSSWLRIW
jgi:hypothetical protein